MAGETESVVMNSADQIVIHVSGSKFVTTRETLARFPTTRIGKLAGEQDREHFYDANEDVFREVLEYHRTGELHAPVNICFERFLEQLKFWGIDQDRLEECCQSFDISDQELEKQFDWFEKRYELEREPTIKDRIWYFLTDPAGPYTKHRRAAMAWTILYCTFTLIQTANISVYTIPPKKENATINATAQSMHYTDDSEENLPEQCNIIREHVGATKYDIVWNFEEALFVFFLLEIFVRFLCCPNKRQFWCSANVIDIIIIFIEAAAIIVVWVIWLLDINVVHDSLCMATTALIGTMTFAVQMRCMRVLAFATIFSRLRVLLLAIYNSKTEISLLMTAVVMSSFIFGPSMFYLESLGTRFDDRTPNLQSIPTTYWWVIVTMSTVGYGDYYPTNILGYLCALFIMMFGLMVTALPVAIVGGNFTVIYRYNIKREKRLRLKAKEEKEKFTSNS